jgi:Zn-dependent peptidase ImmA (M78 family)
VNDLAMNADGFKNNRALVMKGMQAAIAARGKVKLDQKGPICIYSLCEALGVSVRFNDINMEGMYDRTPRPRIHVSALRPLARRVFTCAHELGHHVFGHGSTIDELKDDNALNHDRPPEEILADSFAAFLLMPTLGLREAFTRRNLDPNSASAKDVFSIACHFGVGQSTLVNHMAYAIRMINGDQRSRLGKVTPKMIRTELLGEIVPEPLIVADQYWSSTTLDAEQGTWILLPHGVVVDTKILMPHHEVEQGRLFKTVQPGMTRVVIPGSGWATYVRVAKRQYVGLARYRHLEDNDD